MITEINAIPPVVHHVRELPLKLCRCRVVADVLGVSPARRQVAAKIGRTPAFPTFVPAERNFADVGYGGAK